jgi:ABC-type uncharacterized transport system permease subunit
MRKSPEAITAAVPSGAMWTRSTWGFGVRLELREVGRSLDFDDGASELADRAGTPVSRPRSTAAILLYFAAGLGGALLALFGGGGIARVVWGLFAVVFVMLGITLAVYHSRRS